MDSGERIANCFQSTALDAGLVAPDREEVKQYIGISLEKAWSRLYPSLSPDILTKVLMRYREYWISLDRTPMPLFKGVSDGLRELSNKGYWLAVATGKSRAGLNRVLQEVDFAELFLYTRCADEARSKPHPQMLIDILDYTGLEANQAVMVGDTSFDMEMARGADIERIGVSYGSHDHARLSAYDCLSIESDFAGVVRRF